MRRDEGPLLTRNKIARALENWQQLGCRVIKGDRFFVVRGEKKQAGMHLLVFGCSKDGRAILIYPTPRAGRVPLEIARFMLDFHERGALVGCAKNIGDAFDIVISSAEYPRKKRTYRFIEELAQWKKRKKHGEEE